MIQTDAKERAFVFILRFPFPLWKVLGLGFAASKRVGHPVMRSQAVLWNILPPFARRQVIAALRMERIVDAIVAP